jgi:hypothetical protein
MKNIFELNESQKNKIRNLHNSKKTSYGTSLIKEDAGMDTPGGNPDYFYGDGSLDKIRKIAQKQEEDFEYISNEEMDKLELELGTHEVAEEIFKLFDHKIAEWVSNPEIRVTKETNDLMTEWKDNAKNQIVRLLKAQHQKDFAGKGYDIPGFEGTMDDLNDLSIRG